MLRKTLVTMLMAGLIALQPITALAAPKSMPNGDTFDAEYYAANNPDVVKAFGTNERLLYRHYILYGEDEGRLPCAPGTPATLQNITFDAKYYAAANPDLAAIYGSDEKQLYVHYILCGQNEGRKAKAPDYQIVLTADNTDDSASNCVEAINRAREALGEAGLVEITSLDEAANIRANEIVYCFSHTRPNGSTGCALAQQVCCAITAGENLAYGYNSNEVVKAWLNSPTHRAIALDPSFTKTGVGHIIKNGNEYWVQLFAQ